MGVEEKTGDGKRDKPEEEPRFEPGLPPSNIHNQDAARALGLKYDSKAKVYRDSEGCPTRDRFGQELG